MVVEGKGLLREKALSGTMLNLILIGILALAFNIQPCKSTLPVMGTLNLKARTISDTEAVLNLAFDALHNEPSWKLRVDIREGPTSPGLRAGMLPEGLELVTGDLVWEGYNNVEDVGIEAKVRAVMDGEWRVQGWAVRVEGTWDNYGALDAKSSEVLTIIVSNGKVIAVLPPPSYILTILHIGLTILLAAVIVTVVYAKKCARAPL